MVYSGCVSGVEFGLAAGLVDTALTRAESENRKQLRINYLRFLAVPRTGLQILYSDTANCILISLIFR